jgi:bifunctional enzyme Fae/Hps
MLSRKKKYLQIALNSSLGQAQRIIAQLPANDRIIIEAGTPLLKTYGERGIRSIKAWWSQRLWGLNLKASSSRADIPNMITLFKKEQAREIKVKSDGVVAPYIIADYKAMDRGAAEVRIAANAGANAITVLGQAPIETIDALIEACEQSGLDAFVDMMNVGQPYKVLRKLKKLPKIVLLHRGVDETELGTTPLPIHMINKVKGAFNVLVAIGGGDTIREVQSAFFNGANIVMLWKEFYQLQDATAEIAEEFLSTVK